MPKYTRTEDSTVQLPDLGLTVNFGDVVELPADFFTSDEQALAAGFTPTTATKSKSADAAPATPAQVEGDAHADSK